MGIFSSLLKKNDDQIPTATPTQPVQPTPTPVQEPPVNESSDMDKLLAFENKIKNKSESHKLETAISQKELTIPEQALAMKNPFRGE